MLPVLNLLTPATIPQVGKAFFFFFFLIFPQPDAVNPTKTSDWGRDYVLRFQPLSVSGVNFRPALE